MCMSDVPVNLRHGRPYDRNGQRPAAQLTLRNDSRSACILLGHILAGDQCDTVKAVEHLLGQARQGKPVLNGSLRTTW